MAESPKEMRNWWVQFRTSTDLLLHAGTVEAPTAWQAIEIAAQRWKASPAFRVEQEETCARIQAERF
jgi:hypothetical protein